MTRTLSVLIPVYNEKTTVAKLIDLVAKAPSPLPKELIVVDDGSTDGTVEVLRGLSQPGLRVIFHERNRGKGAAVRTALAAAKTEFAVIQDAGLE